MSHIVSIKTEVKDLNAVKAACKRLGLEFLENQKTYGWYGRSVGDYPLPEGMLLEDLGKCDHAVRVPGVRYELGLVKNKETGGYRLAFDFFGRSKGTDKNRHDGQLLQEALCQKDPAGKLDLGCGKFMQAYGTEFAKMQLRAKGYMVSEKAHLGGIRLTVTGI